MKTDSDEIVTRKILAEELDKRLKNYPTKKDLQEALENERHITSFQMDVRFESFKNQIKDMFQQQTSDFYTKIDPFLKEIEEARLDREATRNYISEIKKRISHLEQH